MYRYNNILDLSQRLVLAVVIGFLCLGGVSLSLLGADDSPMGPHIDNQDPRKGERGFIALPSADTIQVQNVYSSSAQIDLRFVGPGSPSEPISDTLFAGQGRVYAKPAGFSGFASINADLEVQAVNFDLGETGSHAYLGPQFDANNLRSRLRQTRISEQIPSSGALASQQIRQIEAKGGGCLPASLTFVIPIPLLMKESEGWTARFAIQNLGSDRAVLTIAYCDASGETAHIEAREIGDRDTLSVDLADIDALPAGFRGNAMINANYPLAVASSVQLYNDTSNMRSAYQVATTFYQQQVAAALFKNADYQTSQLCVQNGNGSDRSVSIAYTDNMTVSQTIPAGQMICLRQEDEPHADGWVGGAVITSDQPGFLPAVVVVDAVDQNRLIGRWAYRPVPTDTIDAQNGLAFPLLNNDHQEWTTAIHLTNYGTQATTVTPSFTAQAGFSPCAQHFTLAPGETRTLTQADLPAQFDLGTAYFSATQPVAGVVSAISTKAPGTTDRHFGYGAAYLKRPGTPAATCETGGFAGYRPTDEQFWSYQRGYYMEMGASQMWMAGLTGIKPSNPITIAVIDTGVDLDHLDLAENLVPGYDFVEEDTVPQDTSEDSHGSKVAGIIAARMNNDLARNKARGVVGIGGGNSFANTLGLRIMPLRIAATSTASDLCTVSAKAIDEAVTRGARIINISYGSTEQCAVELAAVQRAYAAGVVIVAGAGNDNSDTPFYPAAYGAGDNENLVIAVAGLDPGGKKAYASNYGSWIDLAASYHIRSLTKDGGYASDSGTSFAAPFVSGLLGILMSNFDLTGAEAVQLLRATADNVDAANPAKYQGQLGAGRINANRASLIHLQQIFVPFVAAGSQ